MATLLNETNMSIDEIAIKANLPMSIVSTQLLLLEFKGSYKTVPRQKV